MAKKSKKNQAQKEEEKPKVAPQSNPMPAPKKEDKATVKGEATKPVNETAPKNAEATPKEEECTNCQTCPLKGCCMACRRSNCFICRLFGTGVATVLGLLMMFLYISLFAAGFVLFLIVRDVGDLCSA